MEKTNLKERGFALCRLQMRGYLQKQNLKQMNF